MIVGEGGPPNSRPRPSFQAVTDKRIIALYPLRVPTRAIVVDEAKATSSGAQQQIAAGCGRLRGCFVNINRAPHPIERHWPATLAANSNSVQWKRVTPWKFSSPHVLTILH